MKWIVKNDNGVLEFKSIQVCTESQFNKITAGINRQRIISWCDDNHVMFEAQKGEQCMSILREAITEVNESEARRMDRLHLEFLKFVDSLPEVDAPDKTEQEQTDSRPATEFVRDILTDIHNTEIIGAIVVRGIGPFETEWGRISPETLTEMCELYLDKHEHKDN